ncbi:sorting nexin 3 [Xylona heveae TC161]|uniref:Sorting nexin 3 n=1 Tax=Xylona heveae (strain CBS 132557 / TC161) TaxID=1328760 RepID=A0A161TG16_XYLHT|nr:sorting nexin 3 [Xylona heveae TC161]KZF25037.1 sorting nexin 3 [Xylona heveae TC161]
MSGLSPPLSTMNLEEEGASPWGDVPSASGSIHRPDQEEETESKDPESPQQPERKQNPGPSASSRSAASRISRAPRRVGAQAKTLEAVDDSLGPLGPLGDDFPSASQPEVPPAPPQKEQSFVSEARMAASTSSGSINRSLMDSVNLDDDEDEPPLRARMPPPVQPPQAEGPKRQTQPSVSVEQAANPTFQITVGDPHKVGDLTSSHIVYQVKTKTTSKAYKQPEFTVSRRYRDFLWLYNSLHNNNPGVVVPPPPEKQAVGRFETNFVESRRAALERMLNKAAAHPILQHDGDLKLFLESDAFNVDVKHKERKDPALPESKGMFSSIGFSMGGGGKFIEHDDWFHDRRVYLDALENQLKALDKALDTVVGQRKSLAEAAGDFSASLHALSAVELSPSLSGPLEGLSDLQIRIRELHERQAQQDVLTLGITVDEYIRLIGSIKTAFSQRQKSFHSWRAAETELQKRKAAQDKILRQGKTQQDRLNQLSADVSDAERKVHQARLLFEDMGRLMRNELERFEREKVEDFKSGVETYLESAVEAQKELIEIWETFLMQLDAEEDEAHSFRPPAVAAVTPVPSASAAAAPTETTSESSRPQTAETESGASAAAIATAEQEE